MISPEDSLEFYANELSRTRDISLRNLIAVKSKSDKEHKKKRRSKKDRKKH